MGTLKNIEKDAILAIKDVVNTYQNYADTYNDSKYEEINSNYIQPLLSKANSLMNAFTDLENTVDWFSQEEIIEE